MSKDLTKYGSSEHGNFTVVDTIAVPHPYTIGPKHIEHASKYHSGMLGEETCRVVHCAHPRCTLKYSEHEQALLVSCKVPCADNTGKTDIELHAYLLKVKPLCEADGFVGFAFKDDSQ